MTRFFGKAINRDDKKLDSVSVRYLNRDAIESSIYLLPNEEVILTVD
jgi:hypothetical protein